MIQVQRFFSDEEVQNAVRTMRHIWQQIKLFSITLPAEINTEFMMSLPIAEKSLDLYHLAFKNFNDVSQSMSRAKTYNLNKLYVQMHSLASIIS